jgi:diacylglycerol kinase family enzyme
MGSTQSTSMRSTGQVDGRPVKFRYLRDEDHPDDVAQQALEFRVDETNDATTISGLDIIAVIPVNVNLPNDHSVLYVQPPGDAASNEELKGVTVFKTFVGSSLPQQFVHDFTPGGLSCWQLRSDKGSGTSSWPNLHIVISTKSGAGLAGVHFEHLVKPMLAILGQHERTHYTVHRTESEHSITEFVTSVILPCAKKGVSQAILLLSGDGGIVDVVNALFGRGGDDHVTTQGFPETYVKPNIALLPMGTGNAMAHSLGITKDHTKGLSFMLRGVHRSLPIFRATFSPGARLVTDFGNGEVQLPLDEASQPTIWGAVVCSWGMHAGLVADSDTEEYRKFGAERFKMAAKEALFPSDGAESHRYQASVSVLKKSSDTDNSLVWTPLERQEHAYVLATMVSNLEEGFTISPKSKPLDGQLRLVHFGPMPGEKIMEVMGQAYQGGKHVLDQSVSYEDIEGLEIKFEGREKESRWRRICVDGKIVRVEDEGWVKVGKELVDAVDIVSRA